MPFPKQAKAPKGAGAEAGAAGEDCCFFCKQQVDQDDEHIKGTCSKCGTRPFCFQCVADYLEKSVRHVNSNSKAMEKGRNIARNRPQDLFAQNRTVQRKPQNCPNPACSGLLVDAELVKPQKQQQQRPDEEEEEEEAGVPTPAPARQPLAKQQQPAKAQPAKPQAAKAQPKAAAPVIKRLVSAPTLPRAPSARSTAEGGDEAWTTVSRAASAAPSRPASSSSNASTKPAATAAAAAAAARKQLEQQREAAAALKLDIAAAGRRSSAAAPASSSSSAAGWGKAPRSLSAPAAKAPGEEWPALGPGGNQQPVAQQSAQPQPSATRYASLFGGPSPAEAAAAGPAAAPAEDGPAPQPAPSSVPQPVAAATPSLSSHGVDTSMAALDIASDSDDDADGLAGSIAAALRQQQALLQQLASGGQPWEQAQQAQQQQAASEPDAGALPSMQSAAPDPVPQPSLLPLPPHLSAELPPWKQPAAVEPAYGLWQQQQPQASSAYGWEQQQQQRQQHQQQQQQQQASSHFDNGYAAGLAAAAAMMQQQQGMGGAPQPFEQPSPPAQAYVPPPQSDEAEVDALLSLLGIG